MSCAVAAFRGSWPSMSKKKGRFPRKSWPRFRRNGWPDSRHWSVDRIRACLSSHDGSAEAAEQLGFELTVPTPVIVEAWRGAKRSARIAALLEACVSEPLLPDLARSAGEAIASVKGATVVDAVVMASAGRRGDQVLTADFADLDRLRSYFPEVRLLQVQGGGEHPKTARNAPTRSVRLHNNTSRRCWARPSRRV